MTNKIFLISLFLNQRRGIVKKTNTVPSEDRFGLSDELSGLKEN